MQGPFTSSFSRPPICELLAHLNPNLAELLLSGLHMLATKGENLLAPKMRLLPDADVVVVLVVQN